MLLSGLFCYNMRMPFSQIHDAWIHKGLVDATFTLHVLPCGNGSWGQVEDLPVDVYTCDFEQYGPPQGFPTRDICCIRTKTAWWVILTKPVADHLLELAQNGELKLGFERTMTVLNERQIGAWLLVRDRELSGEQALEHMDQRLFEEHGQDYGAVKSILEPEETEGRVDPYFGDDDFGKEPLEPQAVEQETLAWEQALVQKAASPSRRIWAERLVCALRRLSITQGMKVTGAFVLAVVIIIECSRLWRLSSGIYGPASVDLEARFPKIRWIDRTSGSVMSASRVSRSLFQAVSHRNPFKVAGSIVEVSVRDIQKADESRAYRWRIILDETGTEDEITAQMSYLSGKEMRDLENALSGYKNLRFILAFKLFMAWGHNGRFIVIFTGLCVGVVGLLVRRVLRQMQSIQDDMAVRDVAASSKILESVAQDAQAAENLMRFNQARRLRMHDKGAAQAWEKGAFDWVELNVDQETGKTKRRKRDDRLAQKRKGNRL